MSQHFWSGKKVFVTGHTGFKGGWLCLWLQKMGAEVTGFALRPPTIPNLFEVANIESGMVSIIGDVREIKSLEQAMSDSAPEIVIHMAAQSLVRDSYALPVETYSTNVMGTVNLLEVVRHTPSVRAVVIVTSDKCYKNKEWIWGYRECEAMGGYDPYSSSKGCAELVTSAYRDSYFNSTNYENHRVALASVRAGNVIGGGDWAKDRLIPDILRAIDGGHPVNIRNPLAIRPWQHVFEPLSGYMKLAQNLYEKGVLYSEGWNFGPEEVDAKPVQWIADRLTTLWGDGASWILDTAHCNPHEAHYLKLDCSKAQVELNWRPKWDLGSALKAIVDWHRAWRTEEEMREFCLGQIDQYLSTKEGHVQ